MKIEILQEKINEWEKLSTDLKKIKINERNLRDEICTYIAKGQSKYKIKKIIDGKEIEAEGKLSNSIDEIVFNVIFEKLSIEDKLCVQMKPTLIKKNYDKLPKDSLLKQAVITKPAAPTLKIKEKKFD